MLGPKWVQILTLVLLLFIITYWSLFTTLHQTWAIKNGNDRDYNTIAHLSVGIVMSCIASSYIGFDLDCKKSNC